MKKNETNKPKKILILGDSLLKPIIINDAHRYATSDHVDWANIEKTLNVQLVNKSKMGASINHGIKLMRENIAADKYDSVLIEYGGNDCDFNWKKICESKGTHLPNISPEEFEQTLREMINIANSHNVKPILMTRPPIIALRYFDWITKNEVNVDNIMHHFNNDVEIIYRYQEYYSYLIRNIAEDTGTEVVDARPKFLLRKDLYDLICIDGIHPTALGSQVIIDAFIEKYKQLENQ